jgi:nucleotide-binding universal stress UspA family protein
MEVKRILWPTDFSENAAKALPYVTSLTEKYQTEIHVLYVIECVFPGLPHHEPGHPEFPKSEMDAMEQWENRMAEKRLNQICENYLQGCPLYIRHVAAGDPAEEILKVVDKEKVDMVVMTTRGRKGRFHFGSVAEKVVQNSPVPVITIPVGPEA